MINEVLWAHYLQLWDQNKEGVYEKLPYLIDPFGLFYVKKREDSFLWKAFQKKLVKQPHSSQEKVRKVFERYGVDSSKGFVEKKYIDLALSALHTMYISDLGQNASKLLPKKVAEQIENLLQTAPPFPKSEESQSQTASREVFKLIWQDAISRDLEKSVYIKELSLTQTPFEYWEYLTKQVAGRDLEEGMILPAVGGEEFYYIYKKINKKGLIAYAAKPLYERSNLKSIIFFRPTQMALRAENMMATLMDNLHIQVGLEGFQAASTDLDALMQDEEFRKAEDKVIVAGYSLAGTYAQRFIAHGDNWRHFSEAFIFNAPGVDSKTAKYFANKINQEAGSLSYTPSIVFFRTEGDFIDQGGDVHLGRGVFFSSNIQMTLMKIIPHNVLENALVRHLSCYLHGNAKVEIIDVKKSKNQFLLSNAKREFEKGMWEGIRKWLGFIFRPIYYLFLSLYSSWSHYFLARDSSIELESQESSSLVGFKKMRNDTHANRHSRKSLYKENKPA